MLKLEDFQTEGTKLVTNFGMHKLGRGLVGTGIGMLLATAVSFVSPGMSVASHEGEAETLGKMIASMGAIGLALTVTGTVLEDASEESMMITAPKGTLSAKHYKELATIIFKGE